MNACGMKGHLRNDRFRKYKPRGIQKKSNSETLEEAIDGHLIIIMDLSSDLTLTI